VTDPGGEVWRVDRRIWRWPRWRKTGVDPTGALDVPLDVGDGLDGVLLAVALVVAIAVAVTLAIALLLPAVLFVAEATLGVVLLAWRAVRGRWTIVAESGSRRISWTTVGGRASRRLVDEVALALATGAPLPPPGLVAI
jgi:hypothetical protein